MKKLFTLNILNKKKRVHFKTIPPKKEINIILFKPKIVDDLFDNNLSQINETKISKNKENLNYNELSTYHTFNVENKDLNIEKNKNYAPKEKEEIIEKDKKEEQIIEEDKREEEEEIDEDRKENSDNIQIEIEIGENKENKEKKEKILLGRKRSNSKREGTHTKFSDDNLRRKIKYIIINELKEFINKTIEIIYDGDLGQGMLIKKFFTLNHKQIANAVIKDNKDFLNKNLKDIFSENISTRYTNYPKEHNKKLIEKLLNENDENKRIYFTNFFSLTFSQCLNHFIGKITIKELEGLKTMDEILTNFDDDLNYKHHLYYYFNSFENIINNKKSRNRNKKINNDNQ